MGRPRSNFSAFAFGQWIFFLFLLCFFGWACSEGGRSSLLSEAPSKNSRSHRDRRQHNWQETAADEIKVMTYNLHNLFDASHDSGKKDYTFLSLNNSLKRYCYQMGGDRYERECRRTHWSAAKMHQKAEQLAQVIQSQGDLPDLLGVQEIENSVAAQALQEKLAYREVALITESPDRRGIDVALFYKTEKLNLIEHEEIVLEGPAFDSKPTRNILWAHFSVRGHRNYSIGVYVNHWPSQAAPSSKRVLAAKKLKEVIEGHTRRIGSRNYHVLVLGDFNTLDSEIPNPFHNVLQEPSWNLSLLDAQQEFKNKVSSSLAKKMPSGSYFYWPQNAWNRFDRILVSQNLTNQRGLELALESFRIISPPFALKRSVLRDQENFYFGAENPKIPFRSNYMPNSPSERGYSDHLPVAVKIKI